MIYLENYSYSIINLTRECNMKIFNFLRKAISVLIYIIFIYSCNSPANSPYPSISFKKTNSIPGNGRSSAVAFVINGNGYVALGRDSLNVAKSDCWEYNPVEDKWNEKTSFPGIARVKAVAVVVSGKAYVGLGFNPDYRVYSDTIAYLRDFWMYDPIADNWTKRADFPSGECDACVSFQFGNAIYVGSGFTGYGFGQEFWKYNPDTNSWIQLHEFPGAARSGAVLCTNGEHVYFGTGYNTYNDNDWWEYFPANDTWKALKSIPDNGRENGVSFSINNRYFVSTGRQFGGNLTGGHVKSDVMEYDAVRNVWYNRGSIPDSGRENAIAFVINGKGYVGLGENDSRVLNDIWCFEP